MRYASLEPQSMRGYFPLHARPSTLASCRDRVNKQLRIADHQLNLPIFEKFKNSYCFARIKLRACITPRPALGTCRWKMFDRMAWLQQKQEVLSQTEQPTQEICDFDSTRLRPRYAATVNCREVLTMLKVIPGRALALPIPERDDFGRLREAQQFLDEIRAIDDRESYPGHATRREGYAVNGQPKRIG